MSLSHGGLVFFPLCPAAAAVSYFDCSGEAEKVEFRFSDGGPGKDVDPRDGRPDKWWAPENSVEAKQVGETKEWRVSPDFAIYVGEKMKIFIDGKVFKHKEGLCTNNSNDILLPQSGKVFQQSFTATECEWKTCDNWQSDPAPAKREALPRTPHSARACCYGHPRRVTHCTARLDAFASTAAAPLRPPHCVVTAVMHGGWWAARRRRCSCCLAHK